MCCNAENNRVITCSRDPVIKMWDVSDSNDLVCEWKGHDMSVTSVDYNA